tara:strand:- start:356 stop:595 length:240 start_codon:yes stop_codon:yes gene_type:complete
MKTLTDLMQLITKAIQQNSEYQNDWFFNFSGHVNQLDIKYYFTGWESNREKTHSESCKIYLSDKEQIQAAYWFIKTKLK